MRKGQLRGRSLDQRCPGQRELAQAGSLELNRDLGMAQVVARLVGEGGVRSNGNLVETIAVALGRRGHQFWKRLMTFETRRCVSASIAMPSSRSCITRAYGLQGNEPRKQEKHAQLL